MPDGGHYAQGSAVFVRTGWQSGRPSTALAALFSRRGPLRSRGLRFLSSGTLTVREKWDHSSRQRRTRDAHGLGEIVKGCGSQEQWVAQQWLLRRMRWYKCPGGSVCSIRWLIASFWRRAADPETSRSFMGDGLACPAPDLETLTADSGKTVQLHTDCAHQTLPLPRSAARDRAAIARLRDRLHPATC